MAREEERQKDFDVLIRQPFNDAWAILKMPLDNNTEEGWNEYADALLKFHEKLSAARSPHHFALLKALYKVIDEAGEVIGTLDWPKKGESHE